MPRTHECEHFVKQLQPDPISPSDGRWLNRDPIEEQGGINLYVMCYNDTINQLDVLGQKVQLCGDRNDLEAWFRELFGVSGFDFSHGNGQGVYTLQGNSAHNQLLISEIAGMLINSERLFKFESKQEMYQHMLARMRVIQFLKNYQPSFGGGKGSRKAPGLKPDGSPETPNGSPSNEDWASSLKSLGSNPSAVTDCSTPPLAAMTLTAAMAGYEITSIFGNYYETTTQNENDWVPGDWGRLANGNLGPYATSYTGGENIVYLGGGLYFAHGLGNLPLKEIKDHIQWGRLWQPLNGGCENHCPPVMEIIRRAPKVGIIP